jgi:hypothetical protein
MTKVKICQGEPEFIKQHNVVLPELKAGTKKCAPIDNSSQDFLTYKFKKHTDNGEPKSNDKLFLNGVKTRWRHNM